MRTSSRALEMTGATSAGRPGLTKGEQMGGMWNSTTAQNTDKLTMKNKQRQQKQQLSMGQGARTDGSFIRGFGRG